MSGDGPTANGQIPTLQADLASRARRAERLDELSFLIVNETWNLQRYRQALLWLTPGPGLARLIAISGIAGLPDDSPYTVWLKRLAPHLHREAAEGPVLYGADGVPGEFAQDWAEWLPARILVLPLRGPNRALAGFLWLALDEEPDPIPALWLSHLADTYGYCLWVLTRSRATWRQRWSRALMGGWVRWLILPALALTLIPVRQSVLAPAEVVALEALAIAAPMDGVVRNIPAPPNTPVAAGDILFELDDTTLRNRHEVALRQLATARADALTAQQKAFGDERSKAELAVLRGRVEERAAEVAYLEELLVRATVRAPRPGVAVYTDVNDWIGRPVSTGERIMQLADPEDAGILIWLPVADAIALEVGAEVRLFLKTAPLSPLAGELFQTSYQATLSPEGIASYRLRARLVSNDPADRTRARLGLQGTAKLHGERAPLLYQVLRRPLAVLRQWSGW